MPSKQSVSEFDAVVVGCGAVGMAAALVLANAGFSVALIGSAPAVFCPNSEQPFDPRVFAISHRSRRILDQLRIWTNLRQERIGLVKDMHIWGDCSAKRGQVQFSAADSGVDHLTWIVEQSALTQALFAAVGYQPSIEWIDSSVEGLSRATRQWQLQTQQADERITSDLVIAADSLHSAIRPLAGLDFTAQPYGFQGVVTTWEAQRPHLQVARQWFDGESVLALLPLPGDLVSMVWSMPDALAQAFVQSQPNQQIESVMRFADGAVGSSAVALTSRGGVFSFPLMHGVAPALFQDGVALMGDAAHVVHPLAGQGLNLGFEDVAEMADLMRNARFEGSLQSQGITDPVFWRAWERRRKAACKPVHWVTDGLHTLFRLDVPGLGWARNTGMSMLNRLPMVKRWLSQQAMR